VGVKLASTAPGRVASTIRGAAPWLFAAVVLAWLFRVVPAHDLELALRRVSPASFVATLVIFVIATLSADSLATWTIYRRCLPDVPLRLGETFRMRGATYLLSVLHYGVGQGGMAYFLNRRYQVPIARAAGAVILTMGTNALTVAFCAVIGVVAGGAPANPTLRAVVLALGCGLPAYLAVIAARPGFLTRIGLLRPLFDAGVRGHLAIGAARLPHILVLVAGHYATMRLFGVDPPIDQALTLLPLVFIVGVLPISPSGLGTAQATAVFLFTRFAAGATVDEQQATVLAYSLSLHFGGMIGQAVTGMVFLRLFGRTATIPPHDGAAGS
jgi:uncharacterized membrane protein YbhN (UPF0104 family)